MPSVARTSRGTEMHAETQAAADWWARPRGEATASWIGNYQHSLGLRHRTAIVDLVRDLQPATLLEVGSHCGPNLMRLARECPELRMIGVDVSADAVQAGTAWAQRQGVADRVEFVVGSMPDGIARMPTGSIDVVLSCYTLAYVAPRDLDAVLYELGRVAKQAVLFVEPMTTGPAQEQQRTLGGYCEWAHDYQDACRWVQTLRTWTTRLVPIDPPVDRLNAICVVTHP